MRRRRRETPRDVIDAALNDANETVLDESEQRALVTAFEASTAAQRRFASAFFGSLGISLGVVYFGAHCACGAFGGGDVWARSALHRWYYVEGARARAFVTMCDWASAAAYSASGLACARLRGDAYAYGGATATARAGLVCGVVASCAWWALGVWGSGTFDAGAASRGAAPAAGAWTGAHGGRAQADAARAVETLRSKMYAHKSL